MTMGFFKGIIFGSVVGGIYGLLKTPRSGKENREALLSYIDDTTVLVNEVSQSVNELKEAVSVLSNEGKAIVEEFTDEVTESVKDFSYEAEPRMRRITDSTEKLSEDIDALSQQLTAP